MSYKYENYGRKLSIREGQVGHTDQKLVGINVQDQSVEAMVMVHVEDAPAIALAILEAAGFAEGLNEYDPGEFRAPVHVAVDRLRMVVKANAERAEREAEDAKVDEYRRAKVLPNPYWTEWEHLTEDQRDLWRDDYRKAREFFAKEEAPAPRVLQYGDPEPDRGTEWRDADGDTWDYGRKPEDFTSGWRWTGARGDGHSPAGARPWGEIPRGFFPMTEVTG